METKICKKCGEEKPLELYSPKRLVCKQCAYDIRRGPTKLCRICNKDLPLEYFEKGAHFCSYCSPPISSGYKRCSLCKEVYQLNQYSKNSAKPHGINECCKFCEKERYNRTIENFDESKIANTKICSKCGKEKSSTDFYIKKYVGAGINNICKTCYQIKLKNNRKGNPTLFRQYYRNAYLKNRTSIIVYNKRRRAIRKNAEGVFTYTDIAKLFFKQQGKCVYCGEELVKGQHIDHIIPLSKGGTNWPDNLQLLCPTCNLRKNAKLPEVYEAEIGFDRQAYEEKIAA